ncbi:unnamed protein product [Clonostachys rhizophaga]|uniref:Vacuolar protein sorting-associated protein 9a n=1 Tax=Clonostachys rhizophaga TaxID=160324 RepID=A0A9N9VP86_9HYPO|nr:unnamed protein product [Clonostachys rhizophaga]
MSPPEQPAFLVSQQGSTDKPANIKSDEAVIMAQNPSEGRPPAIDINGGSSAKRSAQISKDTEDLIDLDSDSDLPPAPAKGKAAVRPELVPSTPPTIPADKNRSSTDASSQFLAPESNYVDPTPPTPVTSQPPSRSPSSGARSQRSSTQSPTRSDPEFDERRYASEDEQENGSKLEIKTIMDQFSSGDGGPGADEVMSPRLEIASPMLGSPVSQHPPRKSSLEPLAPTIAGQMGEDFKKLKLATTSPSQDDEKSQRDFDDAGPPVPPKDGSSGTPKSKDERSSSITSPISPTVTGHRPPPPEPEPEPALPFDFHRFLEQLRNKKADPVARYLKSFLSEFSKKQWMVHEQVKIISDFLAFIANKMMLCDVWREVSDAEFDNAREGMEKLVMNRLYTQTFSPAIAPPKPIPGAKPKRRGGDAPLGPGRRGQHQEDVERDDILAQKINIYGWVREQHLDIPQVGESGKRFLKLAQQELLKIKSYRAPRDKIICVLNCCKVIFGLLKHNKSDSSADSFMPMLIYVVLQSNPDHLVSNVQYILRFRNQEKLGGEAGYYLSSLMGAVQFIENMDRTTLTITDAEFEANVEAAVSAIAEKHQAANSPRIPDRNQQVFNEKTPLSPTEPAPRRSRDDQTRKSYEGTSSNDTMAMGGLLKTIQNPLSTIGRIFSDDGGQSSAPSPPVPPTTPRPPHPGSTAQRPSSRHALSAEEAAARQASAEAAEAQRLHRAEHANVVETLSGMFPDLDKEIISDVVHQKQGRVGLAVDACLALST